MLCEVLLIEDAYCTKTFSQKSMMNQHYRSADLGKPFQCEYYSKSFALKKSRDHYEKVTHLNTKKGVTFKYECKKCNYKTDDKTEFTSHMDHHQKYLSVLNVGFVMKAFTPNHI